MTKAISYSVLMSVYKKEDPSFLRESIESMVAQTLPFSEFVIVKDGKLTKELDQVVDEYSKKDKRFKVISLEKNCGLGVALSRGLEGCKNEYIIRMDSDDIAIPERADKQIRFMESHPQVDACGGNIYEFKNMIDEPDKRIKKMPTGKEIERYIRKRNPLNHMTVCLRKSKIESVGGYADMPLMEDYWLWVRLYSKGGKIDNIDEVLTYARIGNGFEKRRGNKSQMKSWKRIQKYMRENKMISRTSEANNIFRMWCVIHMPNGIRKIIYSKLRG